MKRKMTETEKNQSIIDWVKSSHHLWTTHFGSIDKAIGWEENDGNKLEEGDKDEFIRIIMDFYEDVVKMDEDGHWQR